MCEKSCCAADAGMAELVVSLPLGRIGKNFVRLGAFLELDFGFVLAVALIAVGMKLHRQPAIGALDLLAVCGAGDAEDFVIIAFGTATFSILFRLAKFPESTV